MEEQRKSKRYILRNRNAIAAFGGAVKRVGRIVDISRSGFAMEHIIDSESPYAELSEVAIFSEHRTCCLSGIPCITVYETLMNTTNHISSSFTTKRCGMKFGAMTENQLAQLESFIQNHIAA